MEREAPASAAGCRWDVWVSTELRLGRLRPGIRGSSSAVRVAKHWHRLPGEVPGAPFKRQLENALSSVPGRLGSPAVRHLDSAFQFPPNQNTLC